MDYKENVVTAKQITYSPVPRMWVAEIYNVTIIVHSPCGDGGKE
jgi:hypothetical protein